MYFLMINSSIYDNDWIYFSLFIIFIIFFDQYIGLDQFGFHLVLVRFCFLYVLLFAVKRNLWMTTLTLYYKNGEGVYKEK